MRIYIAGPMRGYKDFNFPAFDRAASRGRALGHEIISPADLDRGTGFNEKGHDGKVNDSGHSAVVTPEFIRGAAWRDFISIVGVEGLKGMLDKPAFAVIAATARTMRLPSGVDAVAVLDGWEKSRGASAEVAIARWIGLPILDTLRFEPIDARRPAAQQAIAALEADINATLNPEPDPTEKMNDPAVIPNGEFVVKDSGERQRFSTGAVRDSGAGKGFFHCLPYEAMERLAQLYEAGALKYGKDNWQKGIPCSRYLDSAIRHALKLAAGWTDEDHAAAVMWNAAGFIWTEIMAKAGKLPRELLDLPQHRGLR